jgi:hypothetical protein
MNTRSLRLLTAALLTFLAPLAAGNPPSNQSDVIGKPFRVSASVTDYCASEPRLTMCEAFEPLLAKFLAESRDASWAAPVERLIEASMRVKGKARVLIRALECRRTLCALEYVAFLDDMDFEVDGSEELSRLMEPVGGVMAPELPGKDLRGKMISVLIWRKTP